MTCTFMKTPLTANQTTIYSTRPWLTLSSHYRVHVNAIHMSKVSHQILSPKIPPGGAGGGGEVRTTTWPTDPPTTSVSFETRASPSILSISYPLPADN
jgi:hypothetical protein